MWSAVPSTCASGGPTRPSTRWWPEERVGSASAICSQGGTWVQFTVVDAIPPRLFSFRWTHDEGETAAQGNSFLVLFELEPAAGGGTLLRLTETGFRERGWDEAKVAAEYAEHVSGWDFFLGRLPPYAVKVGATA